ncbi:MAG: hypothetical protein KDD44_11635 [Bdellovibrionales bacterium]|nr:hypothetical protein [Bdellovibrionales bacterium]
MKDTYFNICRLLAASGYRESELAEFIEHALSVGPTSVLSTVRELRRLEANSSAFRYLTDTPTDRVVPPTTDAALKIERLLVHDAGMSKAVAIEVLSEELRRQFPTLDIPSGSRKGFTNWIRRLSETIPEKKLLFLATAIRNRVVHDAPGDWRLR